MKCTKLEKAVLINLLAMNIGVCSAFASNLDGTVQLLKKICIAVQCKMIL